MSLFLKYIQSWLLIPLIILPLISVGCSDAARPENLEPLIELQPATEITRTEALITAHVRNRGTGRLSYVDFYYGEEGQVTCQSPKEESVESVLTLHLNGLRPGTTYTCYAQGGTSTATLRSQTISFTTVPNEKPVVSPPVALSAGPIGIIVEFEIVEDGGEPVLTAGCDVTDASTFETVRIHLSEDCLTLGKHRLHITGLVPMTGYVITPFASNSLGEAKGESLEYTTKNTILLTEAGTLHELFAGAMDIDLSCLTISGCMNGDDFRFLRHLLGGSESFDGLQIDSRVTDIDLSDIYIVEGGGSYDGMRFTSADELSTGLFADCLSLRSAILPSSATRLARNAFAHCSSLETLTISAGTTSVMPSEDCRLLKAIEVSEANCSFTSIDGVLFNSGATGIVWFPLWKGGAYSLPSTITSIGENAFYGTSITSIEIPSSVTAIGRGAFAESALTEITLPDNITNISEGMFQNCASLATVRLGSGTEYVGNYVFSGTVLKDLYISASIPPYAAEHAFFGTPVSITENCVLHVPYGTKAVYRNNSKWGLFKQIEEYRH